MNLRLPAFIPGMVIAALAHGQVRSASVVYTFKAGQTQSAFRLGDECFVSLDVPSTWGWKLKRDGDTVNVTAEGHTARLETRYVGGKLTIPVRKAIGSFGGDSAWTPGTDNLSVYSVLSELSVRDLKVHAESGLPFKAKTYYLSPGKTVIELDGCRLGSETREDLTSGVSATNYRPNQVRITVSTPFVPRLPESASESSTEFDYQISKDQELSETQGAVPNRVALVDPGDYPRPIDPSPNVKVPVTQIPVDPQPQAPFHPPGSPEVVNITVEGESSTSTVLGIHVASPFTGEVAVHKPDPATLQVEFPFIVQLPNPNFVVQSNAIERTTLATSGGHSILVFHLARSMGSEINIDRTGATINLYKPRAEDSRLSGKIIVVDPGHGGHDQGAHEGDVNEKDLTLKIGLQLARKLTEAGATVILTRKDDTFIPLKERSAISNRSGADFFISCHINSSGGGHSQSGTITFHHKGNRIGLFLAECIQDQIRRVNGLPNRGAMSDGEIYSSGGFSVLRNTVAPCVLIEYGFINNSHDRSRMMSAEFQDSVTTAVVKGLRVYLGDVKPNE